MERHTRYVHVFQKGFALVEAMIMTSVLVFGFVAANKVQVNMIKAKQSTAQVGKAVELSTQKIEQLRNYSSLDAYTAISSGSASLTGEDASFSDSLTITTGTKYKRIDQTISWTNSNGENQSLTSSNYISQNDPKLSGLLFSSNYNSTPLPTPQGSSTPPTQDTSQSTNTATTEVTVPGTNIVLTYDSNNRVTEINHIRAITWTGTISISTGASAPTGTVTLGAVTIVPQTTNTAAITCSYTGSTGLISCIMAQGWTGSILLGGVTQVNVCVSNQQPYTNLQRPLTNQNYLLLNTNDVCPNAYIYQLQTL